jgi:hypothetical protein
MALTIAEILRWPGEAEGWLVLSGGADAGGAVRATALRVAPPTDVGVAYIGLSEASGDATLDDLEDLGARSGYLVNIMIEDDDTIRAQLRDASLIVIDDEPLRTLRGALLGAASEAILAAHAEGAVVLIEGANAALAGGIVLTDDDGEALDESLAGLGWVEGACILPGVTSLADSALARRALEAGAASVVIGIGVGSALALGPNGEIALWGARQVVIALGQAGA